MGCDQHHQVFITYLPRRIFSTSPEEDGWAVAGPVFQDPPSETTAESSPRQRKGERTEGSTSPLWNPKVSEERSSHLDKLSLPHLKMPGVVVECFVF